MNLHFMMHPAAEFTIYLAPHVKHENYMYAMEMVKHFNDSTGIHSMKELMRFRMFVTLHGHTIAILHPEEPK